MKSEFNHVGEQKCIPFLFPKIAVWVKWKLEAHTPDFTLQDNAEAGLSFSQMDLQLALSEWLHGREMNMGIVEHYVLAIDA